MNSLQEQYNELDQIEKKWLTENQKIRIIERKLDKLNDFEFAYYLIIFVLIMCYYPYRYVLDSFPILILLTLHIAIFITIFIGEYAVKFTKTLILLFYGIRYKYFKRKLNYIERLEIKKKEIYKKITIEDKRIREFEYINEIDKLKFNILEKRIITNQIINKKNDLENKLKTFEDDEFIINKKNIYVAKLKLISNLIKTYENKNQTNSIEEKTLIEVNTNNKINENQISNENSILFKNENVFKINNSISENVKYDINKLETVKKIDKINNDTLKNKLINKKNNLRKIDYQKQNEINQKIGKLGELLALEWEKSKLIREGLNQYIENIVQVSQFDDSLGYDIISFNNDGSNKYIEVKTTTRNGKSPFYLTETEIKAINLFDNYYIYRVYDFNEEDNSGKIYIIDCKKNIHKYYELKPISYLVTPK